jgi:hypothetical protein
MERDFYSAFAPVAFTLLGLWFIVVQTRHTEWMANPEHRRRASAVFVILVLPGVMSMMSLIDSASKDLWRASFATASVLGVIALMGLGTFRPAWRHAHLELAQWTAALLYLLVAVVAVRPSVLADLGLKVAPIRVEAFFLSLLLLIGVLKAWMLLFANVESVTELLSDARDTEREEVR